jgi:hypothetical protein
MALTVRGCRWAALLLAAGFTGLALLALLIAAAHLVLSTLVAVTLSGARATAAGFQAFVLVL